MEEIREAMWRGEEIPACRACYDIESEGGRSPRMTSHHSDEVVHRAVRDVGLKLRIFGSHCNLGCYMCLPHNSSTRRRELADAGLEDFWDRSAPAGPPMSYTQFERAVEDILANIHRVSHIKLTGGEPMLLPRHYQFLERIPDEHAHRIRLSYDTNLTVLSYKGRSLIDDIIPRFHSVKLAVSCDHYGSKLAWIRYPIDVAAFEQNLILARPWINRLHCTVSLLNVEDLESIVAYYLETFGIAVEICSVVIRPTMLSIKNHPNKERINAGLSGIVSVSSLVRAELRKPRSQDEYETGLEYIRRLDERRTTLAERAGSLWSWVYHD